MTRRRHIRDDKLHKKFKGKEQRTLLLLAGVVAILVIIMIFKG